MVSTNGAASQWWPVDVGVADVDVSPVWLAFLPGRGTWQGARIPLRLEWHAVDAHARWSRDTEVSVFFPPGFLHPQVETSSGELLADLRTHPKFSMCVGYGDERKLLYTLLRGVANSMLRNMERGDEHSDASGGRLFHRDWNAACLRAREQAVTYGAPATDPVRLEQFKSGVLDRFPWESGSDALDHYTIQELEGPLQLAAAFAELLRDEATADITLLCGDERLRAHKLVLAARSPVFKAQLIGGLAHADTAELSVPDEITAQAMRRLLLWTYTGRFVASELSAQEALGMLVAADFYDLPDAVSACEARLVTTLAIDNAVAVLLLAHRHSRERLKRAALTFLATRAADAMLTPEWSTLIAMPRPTEGMSLVEEVLFAVARGRAMEPADLDRGTKRRREETAAPE